MVGVSLWIIIMLVIRVKGDLLARSLEFFVVDCLYLLSLKSIGSAGI